MPISLLYLQIFYGYLASNTKQVAQALKLTPKQVSDIAIKAAETICTYDDEFAKKVHICKDANGYAKVYGLKDITRARKTWIKHVETLLNRKNHAD